VQETPSNAKDQSARANFQKAIECYAVLVDEARHKGSLTSIPAMVVANLCVSYIMNERNQEAEDLMKQLEQEEEEAESQEDKRTPVRFQFSVILKP
jgi:tetratricopeptide repeat protein 30